MADSKRKRNPKGAGGASETRPNVRLLGAANISRESFILNLTAEGPGGDVLRGLFDEWRATGLSPSGEERPSRRDWARMQSSGTFEDFLERFPPLFFLGNGGHHFSIPSVSAEVGLAALISGDHQALADCAVGDFIFLLANLWCIQIAKCSECGRYFDMGRAPKESYPYGIHCSGCQRAQANKAALAATFKARLLRKADMLVLAAKTLAEWREPSAEPDSVWIFKRATCKSGRQVKRLGMSANWITRHRDEITKLRDEIKRIPRSRSTKGAQRAI
jgi:hypothetical protein